MKRLRSVRLGARLATAGGRPAWVRLGLMAVGFMIGSALLLSAASIVPAFHARDERMYARYGVWAGRHASNALRVWHLTEGVGDVDVEAAAVEPIGDAPVPPGLPRVPGPGEMFVSEGLAELDDGAALATLERRLGGHVVGTIGRDGVDGPDDLRLWIGKPAGTPLPAQTQLVRSFGSRSSSIPVQLITLLISLVAASALLLPIWLFVATATRVSAATREQRLAAVRLTGGTESQVRFYAGMEAGVPAAIGAAAGIPLFVAFRSVLAGGALGGYRLFPSDLTPPTLIAVALLIALPILAVGMSLVAMRRLIVTPLGVTRRIRNRHPGWRWVPVLGLGIALLAWAAGQHAAVHRFGDVSVGLIVGASLALITFGLVGTATWSAWVAARRLARSVRSVSGMLGFRRLEAEPTSVSRVVGGIAVMIAMVGVVQSGRIGAERSEGGPNLPMEASALTGDQVGIFDDIHDVSSVELGSIPGVESVRWTRKVAFGRTGQPIGVVETDGTAATLDAIRDRFAWSGASVNTLPQLEAEASLANDDYASIRRAAMAITLFLMLVSAATLLVAMVDWLMERRRSLAVLSAVGVPASTVRRSILVQVGLPLATSIAFGAAGAVVITVLLYTAVQQHVVIASRAIGVLVIAVILIVLGVTAASSLWLRMTRRPELLREA